MTDETKQILDLIDTYYRQHDPRDSYNQADANIDCAIRNILASLKTAIHKIAKNERTNEQ